MGCPNSLTSFLLFLLPFSQHSISKYFLSIIQGSVKMPALWRKHFCFSHMEVISSFLKLPSTHLCLFHENSFLSNIIVKFMLWPYTEGLWNHTSSVIAWPTEYIGSDPWAHASFGLKRLVASYFLNTCSGEANHHIRSLVLWPLCWWGNIGTPVDSPSWALPYSCLFQTPGVCTLQPIHQQNTTEGLRTMNHLAETYLNSWPTKLWNIGKWFLF